MIDSDIFLPDLHKVVQTTMGWTNSHLHQFVDGDTSYSEPDPLNELPFVNYRKVTLRKVLKEVKDKIVYEYDFGDGWEHEITLEKILARDENETYPVCIEGENSCPPEDCGGIWGYQDLLNIMSNQEHDEYEEMLEWLGGEFDPQKFETKEVNKMLSSENYGVLTIWD